jgi:hypothetical protein
MRRESWPYGLEIEVAAGAAIDAFRHPFQYADRRE